MVAKRGVRVLSIIDEHHHHHHHHHHHPTSSSFSSPSYPVQAASVFLEVAKTCQNYHPDNIVAIGEATGTLLKKEKATIIFSPSKAMAEVLGDELPFKPGGNNKV